MQEVNSGGGTSQAFSEVGVDGNSKQATPTKAAVATKSGSGAPEDSGSSHVYEPPRKRIAVQGRDNAGPVPATSAPGGSATSRAPTAHVAQTGVLSCQTKLTFCGCFSDALEKNDVAFSILGQ